MEFLIDVALVSHIVFCSVGIWFFLMYVFDRSRGG